MTGPARRTPAQRIGAAAEQQALAYLLAQGLAPVARNVGSRLGEIDLIMRDGDELVFVEVRARSRSDYGGAAASIGWRKQQRLRRESQRWLSVHYGDRWPACRFDVCALAPGHIEWIRGAF
ncbi:MAG: YraN family protein [Burkholderiaceae bacterium]